MVRRRRSQHRPGRLYLPVRGSGHQVFTHRRDAAGAINAALLDSLGKPEQAKSEEILAHLASVDMETFVDGDSDAKDFIQSMLRQPGQQNALQRRLPAGWIAFVKGAQVLDNLNNDLGLNPGKAFYNWIKKIVDKTASRRPHNSRNGWGHLKTSRRDTLES